MRAGTYKLSVELAGFTPLKRDNLELQVDQRAVLNFSLAISSLEDAEPGLHAVVGQAVVAERKPAPRCRSSARR